jgi:hypothetical protein
MTPFEKKMMDDEDSFKQAILHIACNPDGKAFIHGLQRMLEIDFQEMLKLDAVKDNGMMAKLQGKMLGITTLLEFFDIAMRPDIPSDVDPQGGGQIE